MSTTLQDHIVESHIAIDQDGVARVAGTGYKVRLLAGEHRYRGADAEQIRRRHPDLTLAQAYSVLRRVAVSEDADFLAEAARRQSAGEHFGGVIRLPQSLPIGRCVDDLELVAEANVLEDHINQVVYLPL